jgi:hypothetical protein
MGFFKKIKKAVKKVAKQTKTNLKGAKKIAKKVTAANPLILGSKAQKLLSKGAKAALPFALGAAGGSLIASVGKAVPFANQAGEILSKAGGYAQDFSDKVDQISGLLDSFDGGGGGGAVDQGPPAQLPDSFQPQGPAPEGTIMGMKPTTLLLVGGGALALILFLRSRK